MPTNETIKRFKEGISEYKKETPWYKKFGRFYRLKKANMEGLLSIAIKLKEKSHLLSDEQKERIYFNLKKMNQGAEIMISKQEIYEIKELKKDGI